MQIYKTGVVILWFILLTTEVVAQNGYLVLAENDSLLVGYIKHYTSISDSQPGLEFWRDKHDKNPERIPMSAISQYAIKKDTFKILRHFKPFFNSDIYYEWVAAKLVSKGKVDLFIIRNYQLAGNKTVHSFQAGYGAISVRVEVATDENMGVERHMYLLEHSPTNFLSALPTPSEKLLETLEGFFPKKYLAKYAEVKGDITYKTVPDLVELYNSR